MKIMNQKANGCLASHNKNVNSYLMFKEYLKKQIFKTKEKLNTMQSEYDSTKNELSLFDSYIKYIKAKMKLIKDILKDYYLELLKEGIDIR